MSRNRFAATRLTPAQAHELWARSDEASAFTRPDHLAQLVDEVDWWGVERSGEIVAAWPLVRAVAGEEIAPPPFCYYVGPMFARSLREGGKYHRYWSNYTEAFSTLADTVATEHRRFAFSLPLGLTDVRVLEWWNFDHPRSVGFHIRPRYTARIDLSRFPTEEDLRQSFARIRKRNISPWLMHPPTLVHDLTIDQLLDFHDEALLRSGGEVGASRHLAFRRLVSLVQSGSGTVSGFIPARAEEPAAVSVVIDGPNESNAVFYSSGEKWRGQGLTAWTMWQALLRARSKGLRWFDFNGANSPRRAADKHFYGAGTELYFDCRFGPA